MPTSTDRFAWLREKRHHRSALADVRRAVAGGWPVDDPGRAALVAELVALLDAPDLSTRESLALTRVFLAMDADPG